MGCISMQEKRMKKQRKKPMCKKEAKYYCHSSTISKIAAKVI
jgi:hypothetical protein